MLTLIEAARAGDLEAIKAAIARGEDPKANDSVALSWAARGGHLECLRLLLPVSDPKARDSLALSLAVDGGHLECLRLLLPVSDPKARDSIAMSLAADGGHLECLRLLLPVSDPRYYSRVLRVAAWKGHTECARLIEDAIAEAERADVKVKQQQAQETNMTAQPTIEKGISIPDKKMPLKYDFLTKMEVGDSVFLSVPLKKMNTIIYLYGKRTGFKYSARTVEGGMRLWRIK